MILIGPVDAPAMHVMTWNVRRAGEAARRRVDRWSFRMPRIAALLAAERPSILGTQETLPVAQAAVREALGGSYHAIGRGRGASGGGEACPVFYDRDRLDLLGWTQRALARRPDRPGSRSWGAPIPRIVVEARLLDRATGAVLRVGNTHLDPFSAVSRRRMAAELRTLACSDATPLVLLGDFNSRPGSPDDAALQAGGALRDAWHVAAERTTPAWNTYGAYRAPRTSGRRIDRILVTPGVEVRRIGIHAGTVDGSWPSDHLPVQAVVAVPSVRA